MAIFVIVALAIVAIISVFFVLPRTGLLSTQTEDVNAFMRSCLEKDLDETINTLSKQGGSYEPDNFLVYNGEKIQYLCYTTENYKACKVQQPLLARHFERELERQIEPKARECMNNLVGSYEAKGYRVSNSQGELNVSIVSGRMGVEFNSPLTLEKEGSQTFKKVSVEKKTELYDLLMIATSIIDFESSLGDSETSLYIQYYPDLRIEKIRKDGGNKVYVLTNVVTNDEFTFASRSLVWPAGYGLGN